LKFCELNDDDDEQDAQTAARSTEGVALYAKAGELYSFRPRPLRLCYRVRDRVRDRDMGRVRDRVRLRGLAIAAPSYSGP